MERNVLMFVKVFNCSPVMGYKKKIGREVEMWFRSLLRNKERYITRIRIKRPKFKLQYGGKMKSK